MNEPKKVMVYFNNGCKARMDIDQVEFVTGDRAMDQIHAGSIAANWDNVCFVQPIPEKEDEE